MTQAGFFNSSLELDLYLQQLWVLTYSFVFIFSNDDWFYVQQGYYIFCAVLGRELQICLSNITEHDEGWNLRLISVPQNACSYVLANSPKSFSLSCVPCWKVYAFPGYSVEKWLHNGIYCPSNRSKKIQETHTAYSTGTQYCPSPNDKRA